MSLTLAELAIHIPGAIDLFEKHKFDYYQNGNRTLEDVCKKKHLDLKKINTELVFFQEHTSHHINMDEMGIERLMDFINVKYHSKEKSVLSNIHANIKKVLEERNSDKSFVHFIENIEEIFRDLMNSFLKHCNKEDRILFPHIHKLIELRKSKSKLTSQQIPLLKNPIHILESEHQKAVEIMLDLTKWTDRLDIPKNASVSYTLLIENLKEFEKDFHMHLHIENNILFPKCIALEDELKKRIE